MLKPRIDLTLGLSAALMLCIALGFAGAGAASSAAASDSSNTIQDFGGNTGWINSPPLRPADLAGKVVLVDFWEYTCVNCLRTLPYLRTWYDRYKDDGFVIVGVHTNEFAFSGDSGNIRAAVNRLGITWPVVLDSNDNLAKRYGFSGWPDEFLYDQNGQLVEKQFGEGNYPQTEAKIQSLLRAKNPSLQLPKVMALLPQDSYDKPGAMCYPVTPETFVGPWHGQAVANAPPGKSSGDFNYVDSPTSAHTEGQIYLSGYWHVSPEGQAMITSGNNGSLRLGYEAIQVMIVMKPESGPVRVNVTQDGQPVAHGDAGKDVSYDSSGASYVTVDTPRAYDVIDNAKWNKHVLVLAPQHFGLGIYDIAFESCEVP